MNVVISQSMYFPWVGLLEQVRLANAFVHYDDVQFTRGFYNRVQIKTAAGTAWLTVPTKNHHRGQNINEVQIDDSQDWRGHHRDLLRQMYAGAPFQKDMLGLVDDVFSQSVQTIGEVSRLSMMALADYFGLTVERSFRQSETLGIAGASSQRLFEITRALDGDVYITGHGAKNYLDHQLFENGGIEVRYMNYRLTPYPQLHGPFTPFVSALDLVANCGIGGAAYLRSGTISWKDFVA
jgi:hypothetical protein